MKKARLGLMNGPLRLSRDHPDPRRVFRIALPFVLSNATIPLNGTACWIYDGIFPIWIPGGRVNIEENR